MVHRQHGQRLYQDQCIPAEAFAPDFTGKPCRGVGPAACSFRWFVALFLRPGVVVEAAVAFPAMPGEECYLLHDLVVTIFTVADRFPVADQGHCAHKNAVDPHLTG